MALMIFFIFIAILTVSALDPSIIPSKNSSENSDFIPEMNSNEQNEEVIETQKIIFGDTKKIPLAQEIDGKSIHQPFIDDYLKARIFFEELYFERIQDSTSKVFYTSNSASSDIRGFILDDEKYAIHLVLCDKEHLSCIFRINGIPTGRITTKDRKFSFFGHKEPKSFNLNDGYKIEVNSIEFDYCNNYRFCDMRHEVYDLVNVSIRR